MDSNLLKEAIADAKAVRQTALANAKVALAEAFAPRFEAMFHDKLKEDVGTPDLNNEPKDADETVSEQEIDELIKELENDVAGAGETEPDADDLETPGAVPPTPPVAGTPPVCPPGCVPAPGFPGAVPPVDGAVPPTPPVTGTPPVDGAVPPTPPVAGTPPSDFPTTPEETDEEVNLDELLESLKKEIEDEESKTESAQLDEMTKLTSSGVGGKTGGSDNKKPSSGARSSSKIESGGLKQHGVPSPDGTKVGPEDATTAKRPNEASHATKTNLSTPSLGGESGPALKASRPNSKGDFENTSKLHEENAKLKQQLAESTETVAYIKGQLNEINLLNAKLLYTNKLFKEYNMNNEQKMRVVEMFDLSKNVREVKLTYANIAESLNFSGTNTKRQVKPSANVQSITEGLASQPVGSTKPSKELISEGKANQMVTRFQQIAGIKTSKK